jgi:hypothetical protein
VAAFIAFMLLHNQGDNKMSNYHVLDMTTKEHEVQVIFHIPIPDENNNANINLRTALTQYKSQKSSQVPWIGAAELTDMENGLLYEHRETIMFDANLSLAQKRTIIDNRYTVLATSIVSQIRSRLKFWGMDRDVP